MLQHTIETPKERAQKRLQIFDLRDKRDPDFELAAKILTQHSQTVAEAYTERFPDIAGLDLSPEKQASFVRRIAESFCSRYRLPVGRRWIYKGEEIAQQIYENKIDLAAHLGALSLSQECELKLIYEHIDDPSDGIRIAVKYSRLQSLDAEILLTAVQQFKTQEHFAWVQDKAKRFRTFVGAMVETAAKQSASSQNQAEQASKSASELSELTDSLAAVSGDTTLAMKDAAIGAGSLLDTLYHLNERLSHASHSLEQAREIGESTIVTVEDLSTKSASIHSIAALIQNITEHSNILALNARIEASRAGNAGLGFAVVASEMKALSEQTAKATREIVAHVEDIEVARKKALDSNGQMFETFAHVHRVTEGVRNEVGTKTQTVSGIAASVDQTAKAAEGATASIAAMNELVGGMSQQLCDAYSAAHTLTQQIGSLQKGAGDFLQNLSNFSD
ncbi:MAG: methyl-accepting chemotaxis protein, partial [Pseudomonadota bacterium]